MDSRTDRLRSEPVGKLLWSFSLPAIAGQLVMSLYTVIDRAFLGNAVGAEALAGVSLAMPIAFVIMAVGMLIGVGSGALVSIRLGERRTAEAEVILGNAFTLIVIASTALTAVLLLLLEPLLRAFGATEQVLPYALQFMRIILFASFFQYSAFGLSAVIRSEGNPRLAMATMMINAGLNVVLDVLFIFVFGWGVPGAATATVISQGVAAIWVLSHFRSRRSVLKLRLANLRLRADVVRQTLAIGLAPFATQLAASLISLLILRGAAQHGGDTAVGAYGVIHSVSMLLMMPVLGIVQGAQPVIGFNWGARQYARVRRALKLAIASASAIVVTGFLIVQFFPAQLIGLFVKDSALVAIGSRGMRLSLLMMPIIGFQIVGAHFFQAIGKAKVALVLSMLRQLIVLIPMLLVLPPLLGLDGVWSAMPISDVVAAIVTGLVLARAVRGMDRAPAPAAAEGDESGAPTAPVIGGQRASEGAAGD